MPTGKAQPQAKPETGAQPQAKPEAKVDDLPQPETPDAPRNQQPTPQNQPPQLPKLPKGVPEAIAGAGGVTIGKAAADAINSSSETTIRSSAETRQKFKEMLGEARYNKAAREVEIVKSYRPELADIATEDLVAVRGYTSDDYYEINTALRDNNKQKLERLEPYIECATSALNQMPAHQGTVFRGADLSSTEAKKYKRGAVITEQAFTSTSTSRFEAFDGNTRFIIESANGKDVSYISENFDEKDVLFPPGTTFRVKAATTNKITGRREIVMQEIQQGGKK